MKTNLLSAVCFSASLILPSWAYADEEWYNKDLQRVMEKNNCGVPAYRGGNEPQYFILTPEYFVTWCERKPIKKLGKIICPDLKGLVESNENEGTARIIACEREYVEVSQEPPSYDLIRIQLFRSWSRCPRFHTAWTPTRHNGS